MAQASGAMGDATDGLEGESTMEVGGIRIEELGVAWECLETNSKGDPEQFPRDGETTMDGRDPVGRGVLSPEEIRLEGLVLDVVTILDRIADTNSMEVLIAGKAAKAAEGKEVANEVAESSTQGLSGFGAHTMVAEKGGVGLPPTNLMQVCCSI